MGHDGLVDSVGTDMPRNAIFWFLATGVFMIALGALAAWTERHVAAGLPAGLGWALVAVALVGGVFIPVSGLWLLLVPGGVTLLRARHHQPAASAA
jgi:hypothetical protein